MRLSRTVLFAAFAWLAACAATPDLDPPSAGAPEGGAEEAFARLGMLVGTWESTGIARNAGGGEAFSTAAVAEAAMDLDGSFLRVRTRYVDVAEGSAAPESLALFTWDPEAELYRSWTFHSSGQVASGSMSYDAEARTWNMAEVWVDPVSGTRGEGAGFMRFTDEATKVFGWESRGPSPAESYRVEGESLRVDA